MKDNMRDRIARRVAYLLPQRVCYWILIRMGVKHMQSGEIVPDVPFTVVLERAGKLVRQ